jgi:RNA polymerase sigma-70 factor (ECF subfamily)
VAINQLRRYWRRRPAEESVPDVTERGPDFDPRPNVDARVDAEAVVRHALGALRPVEREVLTLMAWEGLTVTDSARALGIPPGTARRYLHQARQALRSSPGLLSLSDELRAVKEAQ